MTTLTTNTLQNKTDAHWSGVFAMTLCVFVLIAPELWFRHSSTPDFISP